ncbi:MAG: TIGR03617 family F420-dependent LLM class oxidoreductase [Chloroflexota bacterium]|nr:TIGR03617 family F420-dependent LLM class oxidoreductase [Chloroflexota bacterium]
MGNMVLDVSIDGSELASVGESAARAEALGLAGLWTSEIKHDPFLPLVPAALATSRINLGTSVALAFPRSPAVTAYTAFDLARVSHARFILGLGTQVKAHIERRFAAEWGPPVEKLRDYIGAVRALWQCWQTGERLRYESRHYNLKMMTPFFSPDPLPFAPPPVYIAGVNTGLAVLAGEVCDGFQVHPFHTVRYLEEVIMPSISRGAEIAGRAPGSVTLQGSLFVVIGQGVARDMMREEVRRQIAFYASTPSYRTLLALHDWEETGEQLTALAGRGRWERMGGLITDEMLDHFAVEAETLAGVARAAKERYKRLLNRICFYLPFVPDERDEEWEAAAELIAG